VASFFIILLLFSTVFLSIGAYTLSNHSSQFSTRIYDRNGILLYEIFDEKHRIFVSLNQIPKYLQNATIAFEDKRFYRHFGFDILAILRALKTTIIDGQIQGGSTITQQYVRNAFLTPEKTLVRKMKEIFLAALLEQFDTKEKILEKYLNEVAYGGVNWGVETASRYYFGKEVWDLSLAESAFLASLPNAPTKFSPLSRGKEFANLRKNLILEKMYAQGMIKAEEKENAQSQNLKFTFTPTTFAAPHFVLAVKEELIKKFGKEKVETGGLEVTTTLDLSIQEMAQKIVSQEVEKLKGLKVGNGAALVANPQTGEILALVGSKDYYSDLGGNFNVITSALRQPGSAIKPVMYTAAFEQRFTPATILFDIPTVFYNKWEKYAPVNYDGRFHGPLPLRKALGNSYNVPATRTLAVIGVETMIRQAREMGIKSLKKDGMSLSLTLGGGGVRPIELAQSYQVLANLGTKKDLLPILEVKDSKGNILYKHNNYQREQVVDEEIAYLLTDILSDNDARSWAFGQRGLLTIPGYKVAVKTGTSDDKRDNWAIGYTPNYLVLAWVGNNNNSPMHPFLSSGITGATPIWHKIMKNLLSQKTNKWYQKPPNIIEVEIDPWTGKLACGLGQTKKKEYFIKGTEPNECGRTKMILVDKINGQELKEVKPGEVVIYDLATVEAKIVPEVQDPLTQLTKSKSVINLDKIISQNPSLTP
jgi:1A family penicillin-binding protein